jgi:glucokinase
MGQKPDCELSNSMYILAGDIGGTSTRLRGIELTADRSALIQLDRIYNSQDYPDLIPILGEFITEWQAQPQTACLAIAGAVIDGVSELPNLGWQLSAVTIQTALNIPKVELINDFTAIGYGIPVLPSSDFHALQAGKPKPTAPIAFIGAGTGLGEGFAIHDGKSYLVMPTEGGHADFAAQTAREFAFVEYVCRQQQIDRVSGDRVISGRGIAAIYQFLRDAGTDIESPAVAASVSEWERDLAPNPAEIISRHAIDRSDNLSIATMEFFLDIYGAAAGNLALKILPYGGLYIAGGIAAKNLPLFDRGNFIQRFNHKGRVSDILNQIPVSIILNPLVGLIGASARASSLVELSPVD